MNIRKFLISTTIYANNRTILLEKNDIDEQKTEKRIALVIGNGNYHSFPLKNPVNDVRAMAETLKKLGKRLKIIF